jgi:hypothetical protein
MQDAQANVKAASVNSRHSACRSQRPEWVDSGRSAVAKLECRHRVDSGPSAAEPGIVGRGGAWSFRKDDEAE